MKIKIGTTLLRIFFYLEFIIMFFIGLNNPGIAVVVVGVVGIAAVVGIGGVVAGAGAIAVAGVVAAVVSINDVAVVVDIAGVVGIIGVAAVIEFFINSYKERRLEKTNKEARR